MNDLPSIPRPSRFHLPVLVVALVLAAPLPAVAEDDDPPVFRLGGIQVNEPSQDAWAEALASHGLDTVAVTSYAKQGDWDSDNLWWDDDREGILAEVHAARQQELDAVLVLRVALDHAFERNRFLWHGQIQPRTDAQLDEWFRRYREFVLMWAEVAEAEEIPTLAIGAELNALASTVPVDEVPGLVDYYLSSEKQDERREKVLSREREIESRHLWIQGRDRYASLGEYLEARIAVEEGWAAQVSGASSPAEAVRAINERRARLQEYWVSLIRDVREIYRGRIGFAANFDQFHEVGFWRELDVLGINAYFQLRHELVPGDDPLRLYPRLVDGWASVLRAIDEVRREQGVPDMPVLFTELGYTRRARSTLEPWADTGFSVVPDGEGGEELVVWQEQPLEPRERALAVRALAEALDRFGEPLLEGLLWWKLSTDPGHHDIEAFLLVLGEDDPLWAALAQLRRRALEISRRATTDRLGGPG